LSIATLEKTIARPSFEELGRLERRNRVLGKLAIDPENRLLNNDALADVFLLLENNNDFSKVEDYVDKNYLSDMSERSGTETKEKHFYLGIDYRVNGDDLVADQVTSYREMMDGGLKAAWSDASADRDLMYALRRAQVQAKHIDMLLDWYRSGDPNCVRISSLCPTTQEVPEHIAKKANFKQERLMASEWIFERTADGIRMHAFSQDNLTLEALQEINNVLGINDQAAVSTLDEMDKLVRTPFSSGTIFVEAQRQAHDDILSRKNGGKHHHGIKVSDHDIRSSNEMVLAKPDAQELWRNSVKAVADSLSKKQVSQELAAIILDLRAGFNGSITPIELGLHEMHPITIDQARNFMDYLRKRALPQYIFGDPELIAHDSEASYGSGASGIASAGSYAFSNGISHEGDCQTSGTASTKNATQGASKGQIESAMNVYVKQEFKSEWCPNCLPEPIRGVEVRAWRKGDDIGCYDCGRVQSICTKQIYAKGRKIERYGGRKIRAGFFDLIAADLSKFDQINKQKELVKKRREKLKEQGQEQDFDTAGHKLL
jgi:hypothetical protein